MKLFHWLVTAPLALILIVFAVANRDTITLTFWPLPITLAAPIYLVVLLALLAGFFLGELAAWLAGRTSRRKARHAARRVEELEHAIEAKTPAKEATRQIAPN